MRGNKKNKMGDMTLLSVLAEITSAATSVTATPFGRVRELMKPFPFAEAEAACAFSTSASMVRVEAR